MNHDFFMMKAYKEALRAEKEKEVPVGAVIVKNQQVIARAYNQMEQKKNCLFHAEIQAIHKACFVLGDWRLDACSMYVTLEPCLMCAGAIQLSRLSYLIYGAKDPTRGAIHSHSKLFNDFRNRKKVQVFSGVMEKECSQILTDFFKKIRKS